LIRDIPDFPKPGIVFKDITPILSDPRAFNMCLDLMAERYDGAPLDAIVGIESRGFIFGIGLALHWGVPFVPARKFGKLPGTTVRQVYSLEYGEDTLELHRDALKPGQRVAIVDDLLAAAGGKGQMDLIEEFAYPLPVRVICEMLGVPVKDHERFKAWGLDIARGLDAIMLPPDSEVGRRSVAGRRALADYFRELIAAQMAAISSSACMVLTPKFFIAARLCRTSLAGVMG